MTTTTVLGVDIGLSSMGWAIVEVMRGSIVVLAADVVRTKKEATKRKLHSSSDDARRIDALAKGLREAIALGKKHNVTLAAYELPAGQKSARSAHALGIAHGLVRVCLTGSGWGVIEVTARDAKREWTGSAKASKDEMIAAAMTCGTARSFFSAHPRGVHEHLADAMAVAMAGARVMHATRVRYETTEEVA